MSVISFPDSRWPLKFGSSSIDGFPKQLPSRQPTARRRLMLLVVIGIILLTVRACAVCWAWSVGCQHLRRGRDIQSAQSGVQCCAC